MQKDFFDVKTLPSLDTFLADAPQGADDGKRLRILIATEEILGPVRNGGIASTYYHLARGLAARGHEVHVLFLKGTKVENETPEHWVEYYASFGITLHYLDFDERPLWAAAPFWQVRYLSFYDWLKSADPFDVVHTSEWRGGAIYVLMAKRLGHAFENTTFIVKTSSPYIWNRHYQMEPFQKMDLLAASFAEQKCVELADMVVGGSAHLISFMDHIGYRVRFEDSYVQPNILDFSDIKVEENRGEVAYDDVIKTRELTFFGRLEGRKGLELFCSALDILIHRGIVPEKVNFLGKAGGGLANRDGQKVLDYIEEEAANWPFPIEIITDRNQPEALSFLCSREMVAVMPSLIENSTMAVYETLENRIPFVATAVGGTPELIDPAYHDRVLIQPTSQSLAARLEAILDGGQVVARPSYSNDENLRVWYDFHNFVAHRIAEVGPRETAKALRHSNPAPVAVEKLAVVALMRGHDTLDAFVDGLLASRPDAAVLCYTSADCEAPAAAAAERLAAAGIEATALEAIGRAAGEAFNAAVAATDADALVLADGTAFSFVEGFCEALKTGLAASPDDLCTTFFRIEADQVGLPIGGDVASQIFNARAYGPEIVALRRTTLEEVGGFETYDVRHGLIHEVITRAVHSQKRELLVLPEILFDWRDRHEVDFSKNANYKYFRAKALLDESSLDLRKTLLFSLQQQGAASSSLPKPGDEEPDLWWVRAGRGYNDGRERLRSSLAIGLKERTSEILFVTHGPGQRTVLVNGRPVDLEPVLSADTGTDNEVTIFRLLPDPLWLAGDRYSVEVRLTDSDGESAAKQEGAGTEVAAGEDGVAEGEDENAKHAIIFIDKLAAKAFLISSRDPILATGAIEDIVNAKMATTTAALDGIPDLGTLLKRGPQKDHPGIKAKASQLDWITGIARPETEHTGAGRIEDGWINGWAWDPEAPDVFFTVVLYVNGKPRIAVRADRWRRELNRSIRGLGDHAFRLPLSGIALTAGDRLDLYVLEAAKKVKGFPIAIGKSVMMGKQVEMAFNAEALGPAPVDIADVPELEDFVAANAPNNNGEVRGAAIRFSHDGWTDLLTPKHSARPGLLANGRIDGWAWDRVDKDRVLSVILFVNGKPARVVRADWQQPELGKQSPGLGRHAFRMPLDGLDLAEGDRLEMFVLETATKLRNTPLIVDRDRLVPPTPPAAG